MSMKIHQKCPRKFTQKMSTKIQPKRGLFVDILSTRIHPFSPRKFVFYVPEKSATRLYLVSLIKYRVTKNAAWIFISVTSLWRSLSMWQSHYCSYFFAHCHAKIAFLIATTTTWLDSYKSRIPVSWFLQDNDLSFNFCLFQSPFNLRWQLQDPHFF